MQSGADMSFATPSLPPGSFSVTACGCEIDHMCAWT